MIHAPTETSANRTPAAERRVSRWQLLVRRWCPRPRTENARADDLRQALEQHLFQVLGSARRSTAWALAGRMLSVSHLLAEVWLYFQHPCRVEVGKIALSVRSALHFASLGDGLGLGIELSSSYIVSICMSQCTFGMPKSCHTHAHTPGHLHGSTDSLHLTRLCFQLVGCPLEAFACSRS